MQIHEHTHTPLAAAFRADVEQLRKDIEEQRTARLAAEARMADPNQA